MRSDFLTPLGELFLRTEFDSHQHWIYNDWVGLLPTPQVIEGSLGVLHLLENTRCPYMLNSNLRVLGSWKAANHWIESTWIPRAQQAGLRYHAHVLAPGVFGQAAAEDLHLRVGSSFQMHFFDNLPEAQHWLRTMQALNQ